MKTTSLLIVLLFCTAITLAQQEESLPLIGSKAPSFTANTTNGKLTFPDDFGNSWKILFSHPRDFTPVCTSEVIELTRMQSQFKALNTKFAIISTDDCNQHEKWKEKIESIVDTVKIDFPIIDDFHSDISRKYGMIEKDSRDVRDVRCVFFIDPDNVIQAMIFYPRKVGRNMEEVKRALIALQSVNSHKDTPVNWEPGDPMLMIASPLLDPKLKGDTTLINKKYFNVGNILWYEKTE